MRRVKLQKKRVKQWSRKIASSPALFIATLLYLLLIHELTTPKTAYLEDKDLSVALASTDCPPYSIPQSLKHAIDSAEKTIEVAIYALQDKGIIHHLRQAAEQRNVSVTVVVDPSASEDAPFLLGPKVAVYERKLKGLMHIKLLVVDQHTVWYGTMNFTKSSLFLHGNMACGIKSKPLAHMCHKFISSLIHQAIPHTPPLHLSHENKAGVKLFFSLHPQNASISFSTLIQRIEQAKKRVFVAMYTFTHRDIANKLVAAKKRGVDVRVLFDTGSVRDTSKKVYTQLRNAGLYTGTRRKNGLLHYKCAIIDSSLVIGSSNWTKAAFTINSETFSIIDNLPPALQQFLISWWNAIEQDSTLYRKAPPLQTL